MPRKLRDYADSGVYHVYNRGARRHDIFADDVDRRLFLHLLGEAVGDGLLECFAFCLMGNHYHLLVRSPGRGVSIGVHRFTFEYVRKFNDRHGFDGPLFRARFGSTAIEDDSHSLETLRYIHNNPLDIGQHPDSYRWSSQSSYLSHRPAPSWLSMSSMLEHFQDDLAAYARFISRSFDEPIDG